MSCCGQRRQALNVRRPQRNEMNHEPEHLVDQPQQVGAAVQFKYTGSGVLEINGFMNLRKYRFSAQTPVISVAADDISTIRGYDDLVEVR